MDFKRRPIGRSPNPRLLRALLLMASLGISMPLHAHGDLPYLRQIFLQDGELQGGAASYGLLTFEEDPALWTTEDTLPSEPRLYHRLATGGILAAGFKGLFKSQWLEHDNLVPPISRFCNHILDADRLVMVMMKLNPSILAKGATNDSVVYPSIGMHHG